MSEVARSRRDDVRYEPRVDMVGREAPPAAGDPLAELARLVGQDDPFRGVFRPTADRSRVSAHEQAGLRDARPPERLWEPPYPPEALPAEAEARHGAEFHEGHHDDPYVAADHGWQGEYAHAEHGQHEGGYDADHDDGTDPAYGEHYGVEDERYYAAEQDGYHSEAGLADGHLAAEAAAATLPDMWARGGDDREGSAPPVDHDGVRPGLDRDPRSSARRPLAVLAAVLVLTGGGLAASFLVKGPSTPGVAVAGSNRTAPTIMAAVGPTKVKVDEAGATAPEDQDAALLNKGGNVSSGPVRIVSSQEQPADLNQLPKSSDLGDGARPLPPAAPSPFPEPKRVKTFVVHPDGTMLSATGSSAANPPASDTAGTPAAATPRLSNRGATTPSAAPTDAIAALAAPPTDAVGATPPRPARQPASPGVRTASAKLNDTADAPAANSSATGGTFGVQLASSPVEADANAAFAKLKKRYPAQLGALTASVHKAETGDRPVYRVRVGSMSQDEAKSLCTQLQGAGGSCFVVHN